MTKEKSIGFPPKTTPYEDWCKIIKGYENLLDKKDKEVKDLEWQLKEELEDNDSYQKDNTEKENDIKELLGIIQGKDEAIKELREENKTAKEIIKKFSDFVNNKVEYDPEYPQEHTDSWNKLCEKAEQFLKECEE